MIGAAFALSTGVLWGVFSVSARTMGIAPRVQSTGLILGNLLVTLVALLFTRPAFGVEFFVLSASGVSWAVGMLLLLDAFPRFGISRAVPLTGGVQALGAAVFGYAVMGEGSSGALEAIGTTSGIGLVIAGTLLFASRECGGFRRSGFLQVIVASLFFLGFLLPVSYLRVDAFAAMLPQAVGMLLAGAFIAWPSALRKGSKLGAGIIPGVLWGAGNMLLLLALPMIGVARAFTLTRFSSVISVVFGILVLREAVSRLEATRVIIAAAATVFGSILIVAL